MGDPAGIGPEITVRALNRKETYEKCQPIVTGDAAIMEQAVKLLGYDLKVNAVQSVKDAKFEYGTIDVYDLQCVDLSTFEFGKVQPQCGNAAFQYIKKAIDLAMADEVDGTVTAPLNKEALNLAGHHYDGHTEIYATFTGTKKYAMMLADENIRVIHVSTHVPLRKACDLVKKARIIECVELIDDACRQFGIEKPHIGVAGLNPHSSENGMFGYEEAQEIIPAIEELKGRGFDVEGPVPPDSIFAKANKETGKMESASGVNITLGLPIIRVSVDHGTAFDVAGKGIANDSAMTLSIDYATRMAIYRKEVKRS